MGYIFIIEFFFCLMIIPPSLLLFAEKDKLKSLNEQVISLYQQGKYHEAIAPAKKVLSIAEKKFGPDHPDTAQSLSNLAALYREQGRYDEAEPLYTRALKIREKALGPDHPDTAQSLSNLAALYREQGRYDEAEPLFKRALKIYEKAMGPDHPYTATSLNNLTLLYYSQGKYAEAEPLYKRALKITEKALGPDHPGTATSLNNLAALYRAKGRYDEAEPLFKRALKIYEKAMGPDHPNTATSLNNLASLYYSQGRYSEAKPLYKRALKITKKALGPDHPGTATSLNNLAALYELQDRYDEAEPLYKQALKIREKALGPDHPDTATSLNDLAALYDSQGMYVEAEPLYKRALKIREKVLGPDHPDTAISLNDLALLYKSQGRYTEAEPLFKRALKIYKEALGPDHPYTATSLNNLAELSRAQGRYDEEEPLFKRALKIREKVLGPDEFRTGIGVLFDWGAIQAGTYAWQAFCESCDPKKLAGNTVLMTDVWNDACKIEIKALASRQHAFCIALPDARSEEANYVRDVVSLKAAKLLLPETPFVSPSLVGPGWHTAGRINFEGVFTLYDGDFLWVLLRAAKAKWNCSVSTKELNRFLHAVMSCSPVADDEMAIYAHAIGAHRLDQALTNFRSDYLTHWSEDERPARQRECEEFIARLKRAVEKKGPSNEQTNKGPGNSKTGEYSLLQLSTSIFMNTPSSSDDDQHVKQAYSLMQNTRWGEARQIIQDGLQTCNKKDRLCELIANLYLNEKNPVAIGWYMQSCVIGSPSWVPYLMVSYAAHALGLDDIAWRCLNACDVIDTGMKRIDKLETDIADLVNNSDRSELLGAMQNFVKTMDPYLPSANEIPHDQMKRATFLLQNITGDPEMQPLKQRLRLMKRKM